MLTARARELIERADVIVRDRLIPEAVLAAARSDAEIVYAGKRPGAPAMEQEQINALLVDRAREGKLVVRLKGGDPFVFGRGGEEAQALRAAEVPYEVVPAVTAGVAAAAYAGIPLTHRKLASAVAFVTGHEDPDKPGSALDWDALAAFPGTLVFYMGLAMLPTLTAQLMAAGRSEEEPAAVVERGTLPGQRVVQGTLGTIAERAQAEGVRAPAVTVVGPVAALRDELAWLEERPLHGRTVAVTRARAQASELAGRLRSLGAEVVEAPAIRIHPLDAPAPDLSGYDLLCLTSPNGVRLLFDGLRDARDLAGTTVAAIGPGTARALREHGVEPDVVPERSVAEALLDALEDVPARRALIARAREARDVLPEGLRGRGIEVDVLELYETVAEPLDGDALAAARAADWITFTSSSTVRFFLEAVGRERPRGRVVSIGPVTSAALREHGLEPDVEAPDHDIDGVVMAIVEDARR